MLRTQIRFSEEQHRLLRAEAHREDLSIAEVVRRCVARFFEEDDPDRGKLYDRAAGLVGKFDDSQGETKLSGRHDEYLDH